MRPAQLLLAAALAILAAAPASSGAKTPLQNARQAFEAEAARQCPTQRLQDMTAGDLELLMEGFEARLTPAEKRQNEDAVGYHCARIEAGLTCGNSATLSVYQRIGKLKAFVHDACASGWTCKAFADCTRTKP